LRSLRGNSDASSVFDMATLVARVVPFTSLHGMGGRRGRVLVERSLMVYRHTWLIIVSGFFEPVFYLLSIGVGLGHLVPDITVHGHAVGYTAFVAPALLASSAMNGAIYDSTFNIFWKLKYVKIYEAVLSTPLGPLDVASGEITWALGRGFVYSAAFLIVMSVMGLLHSWWALLCLPFALLEALAFAACGMAFTTFMRSWQDFEWVTLAILPMFLFSATFYPLTTYPRAVADVVRWTPLYQAVDVQRALALGHVGPGLLANLAYLLAMGVVGVAVATRRLGKLLLR
jgi:lipooligosaccharide transport system permease protein